MNANKLFKLLKNSTDSFDNLDNYKKILEQSSRLLLNFSNFKSFDVFIVKTVELARQNGLSSPFDNVILDITNVLAPELMNGLATYQNLMLHLIPIQLTTDVSTFTIMLVQDLRPIGHDIYPRSHIISLNKNDLLSMPAIDTGMTGLGCKCYLKNPFTHHPIYKQIQSFTPGFKVDCGFAAADCPSKLGGCRQVLDGSKTITSITVASMIYTSMPCHKILQVVNNGHRELNGLKQMPHFILVDKQAVENLKTGKPIGDLQFNDGNDFEKFYTSNSFEVDEFTSNGCTYIPVVQK